MSDKTYDFLKNILIPVLTGGATLVLTLGDVWHIPYAKEVGATLTAIATFVSFLINQSSAEFFKNKEIVEQGINNKEIGDQG